MGQLGGANPVHKPKPNIKANVIASHLMQKSKAPLDKATSRKVKLQLAFNIAAAPKSSAFSAPFTVTELDEALAATKAGKAAGPDGIFPEFLKGLGPNARRWLAAFFSSVMASGNIPAVWRRPK